MKRIAATVASNKPRNATTNAGNAEARPIYLQLRRRDLGGGRYAMIENASVSIRVRDRHWGSASIGYSLP